MSAGAETAAAIRFVGGALDGWEMPRHRPVYRGRVLVVDYRHSGGVGWRRHRYIYIGRGIARPANQKKPSQPSQPS